MFPQENITSQLSSYPVISSPMHAERRKREEAATERDGEEFLPKHSISNEMREGVLTWRPIPRIQKPPSNKFSKSAAVSDEEERDSSSPFIEKMTERERKKGPFASVSVAKRDEPSKNFPLPMVAPTPGQLLKHPLALLAFVPKDAALFVAGAIVGAAAKTLTAPLDHVKLPVSWKYKFYSTQTIPPGILSFSLFPPAPHLSIDFNPTIEREGVLLVQNARGNPL